MNLNETSPIQVEFWRVDRLRTPGVRLRNNDRAVDRMIGSIESYGFKIPLLVSPEGALSDGELRLKAARRLGFTELPVIVCRDWSPEQIRGFRLLVNRSSTWAEWNLEAVAKELADLHSKDFDLSLTGFTGLEVDALLTRSWDQEGLDARPVVSGAAVSRAGDLWVCGRHRVWCGDSTDPENVQRLFGSEAAGLMITDPPYGVHYDPNWREQAGLGKQRQTGLVQNDDRINWSEAFQLFTGNVAYVWHAGLFTNQVAMSLEMCGFEMRAQIIWAKQHFALSRGTITGSTNRAGMRFGKVDRAVGAETANSPQCGRSRI